MGSQLFKQFIKKSILSKQGAPGPPPRQGLQWKPQTHRWIRPKDASTGEAESSQLLPSSSERYSGFAGKIDDSTKEEVDKFLPTIIDDTLANDKSFLDNFYSSGQGYGVFSETPSITREGMTLAIAWLEDESDITVSDFDYQEMEGQYTQNDLRDYIKERLVALGSGGETGSSTVSEVSDDQPVKPSGGWESHLHEIAYENIRDEVQMSGIPEAEHFNNAKEYASYIDSSVWQSMIDIRNDMEDEEDYFLNNVGFEDTEENVHAYMTALEETAKDYAENIVDQKVYGTGVHVDEMEDEDYEDEGW